MSARARILIAPDSFKGTYSAEQVCDALAEGVEAAGAVADRCPVADGGEGTSEILRRALGGIQIEAAVTGPLKEPRQAAFTLVGEDAYLDLAEASGIAGIRAEDLDPIRATTAGTGELMLAAQKAGARHIFVAAGGSATVDGGAGAIRAIENGGGLDLTRITVLCDVDTVFEMAPAIFGPQKGATPEMVKQLEARLAELAKQWPHDPHGLPMSGAAGGFSGGAWAVLGARLVPGAPFVLDRLDFNSRLDQATAVIAGEGGLDDQSFMGKIVGQIVDRSAVAGKAVHAVCGRSELDPERGLERGVASIREAGDPESLRDAGRQIAEATIRRAEAAAR